MSIAVLSGSLRSKSINTSIAKKIVEIGTSQGKDIHFVDITTIPLYNQDLENPYPPEVSIVRERVQSCNTLILVVPENNHMPSAATKNILDWLSRGGQQSPLQNKIIYLVSGAGSGKGVLGQNSLWEGLEHMNKYQYKQMTLKRDKSIGFNVFTGEDYVDSNGNIIHPTVIKEIYKIFE